MSHKAVRLVFCVCFLCRIGVRRVKEAAEGVSRAVTPWSVSTQGVAVGTAGFILGNVLGAPVQKVPVCLPVSNERCADFTPNSLRS